MAESVYATLPEGHVRLLEVSHSPAGGLNCSMTDVALEDVEGQFCALSYAWGTDTSTKSVLCNGHSLDVRVTLHEAIETLFAPPINLHCRVWIDAICINQEDDTEKSVHVAKMGEVYRSAHEVVVWLGAAGPGNDLAMDKMEILNAILPTLTRHPVYDELPRLGLPHRHSPLWPALSYIFRRPWFERLWTFQEAVLASQLLFVCGHKSSKNLVRVGSELWRLGLLHICVAEGVDAPEDGFLALEDIRSARDDMLQFRGLNFTYLLSVANSKHCFDPRDRVYAMLGMAHQSFRERINVSYDPEPVSEAGYKTFINCAKACIEGWHPMILELVAGREPAPGLPSWVPNFKSVRKSDNFGAHARAGFPGDTLPHESFRATVHKPDVNKLTVTGFQVDTVSDVLEITFPNLYLRPWKLYYEIFLRFEAECLALARRTCTAPSDVVPIDHVYAMTAYTSRRSPNASDEDLRKAFLAHLANFTLLVQSADDIPGAPEGLEALYGTMWRWIEAVCRGRRYFSTSGRVGIGPTNVRAGDKICVLYGTRPVFVLREAEGGKGEWTLVGDAFVPGLMDLDKTPQNVRGPDEDFVIV